METTNEISYELILAIVNKGETDLVLQASNHAGARGGTISTAKGTGNPELAKFYGIVIQPEKEMVFIVVEKKIKDKVMKQIYEEAGLATKGRGIIISLPITATVGLNTQISEEK
jgi:nitrogen regulatory protein PII